MKNKINFFRWHTSPKSQSTPASGILFHVSPSLVPNSRRKLIFPTRNKIERTNSNGCRSVFEGCFWGASIRVVTEFVYINMVLYTSSSVLNVYVNRINDYDYVCYLDSS